MPVPLLATPTNVSVPSEEKEIFPRIWEQFALFPIFRPNIVAKIIAALGRIEAHMDRKRQNEVDRFLPPEQLTLFPLERHEVVPLDPQPYQKDKFSFEAAAKGDWIWAFRPGCSIVSTYPEERQSWVSNCPFKPEMPYGNAVIDSVRTMFISTGWVWVIKLRSANENDLQVYWYDIGVLPKPTNCQWPDDWGIDKEEESKETSGFGGPNDPVYTLPIE